MHMLFACIVYISTTIWYPCPHIANDQLLCMYRDVRLKRDIIRQVSLVSLQLLEYKSIGSEIVIKFHINFLIAYIK